MTYLNNKTKVNQFVNVLSKRTVFINKLLDKRDLNLYVEGKKFDLNKLPLIKEVAKINNSKLINNSNRKYLNLENFLKNQYKPLRKGINNLIRLHATNAVGIPIEMRIQILASSRDVIHS